MTSRRQYDILFSMHIPKIVIVGSGFGGVYTAKHLKKLASEGKAEVTLINRTNYFLFTPLLHEVATGGLSPLSVAEPIREIFRNSKIHFLQAEVKSIDDSKKIVLTSAGKIAYDFLVISSGATTNFYGIPGAEKYSLQLKNIQDALDIRSSIIKACEKAATVSNTEERRRLLSFTVVGGGATGVELAAELVEFAEETLCTYYKKSGNHNTPEHACSLAKEELSVNLVYNSPELIPHFPATMRSDAASTLTKKGVLLRANAKVTEVKSDKIILSDGNEIPSSTTIWVAGVAPAPLPVEGLVHDQAGRIKVDQFMRAEGKEHIFALGDVSHFMPVAGSEQLEANKPLPMLAQVAVQQGKVTAHNIAATILSAPLHPFAFLQKGLLISLGQWHASGDIFGVILSGRIMWWIWRTVYLFNFHSWRKRFRIAAEWTVNLFYPRDITSI